MRARVPKRSREYLALGLIVALAAALRFWRITEQSIWADEAASLVFSLEPAATLLLRNPDPGNPPLYYLMLQAWMRLFGESELALRALPALAGILSVPALHLLGRELLGVRVGLVAAFLLAVSKTGIYYSQESRAYAPLMLLGILAALLFVRAMRTDRWSHWVGAGLLGVIAFYLHYAGILIPVFQGTYVAAAYRRPRALAALGMSALLCLPAVALYIAPAFFTPHGYGYWQKRFSLTTLAKLLDVLFGKPIESGDPIWWKAGVGLLLAGVSAYPVWHAVRGARSEEPAPIRPLLFVLCLCLAPVLFFALLSSLKPLWYPRYLLVAWPGYLLLAAWAVVNSPRVPRALFALALAAVFSTGYARSYALDAKEDWRGIAAAVEQATGSDHSGVVLLSVPKMTWPFGYYYRGQLPCIGFFSHDRPVEQEMDDLVALCRRVDTVFVIQEVREDGDRDLRLVRRLLEARGPGRFRLFTGVRVHAFGTRASTLGGIVVTKDHLGPSLAAGYAALR